MVKVIVIDHGVEGPYGPQRIEFNANADFIDIDDLRDLIYEKRGLAHNRYTLVIDEEIQLTTGFVDGPVPTEVHLYRKLNAEVKVPVLTTYQGTIFHSILRAGTTVEEYRRLLARRFLVRPALQVLYSMKILMEDHDELGTYTAGGPVRICLKMEEELARPAKVFISVKRRREPGYLAFVVDDVETFDMLAGRLERESEVREGEEVTFVSEGTVFANWRMLREYKLTRAKLQIFE